MELTEVVFIPTTAPENLRDTCKAWREFVCLCIPSFEYRSRLMRSKPMERGGDGHPAVSSSPVTSGAVVLEIEAKRRKANRVDKRCLSIFCVDAVRTSNRMQQSNVGDSFC